MDHRDDALIMAGYILAKGEVPSAMEQLINRVMQSPPSIAESIPPAERQPESASDEARPAEESPLPSAPPEVKERKKREWSPEQRQAAADRMRARMAAGKMKRRSDSEQPSPDLEEPEGAPPGESSGPLPGVVEVARF